MVAKNPAAMAGAEGSLYQSLIQNISVGVFRTTPGGKIVAVNPATVSLMGYNSPQEMMALSAASFYAEPTDRQKFLKHLEQDQGKNPIDLHLRRKDGSTIWCKVSATPIRDDTGELLYIDGTVEKITEQRQTEEKLRQQNLYLQSLQDVMLAVVSRVEPLDVLETVLNRAIQLMKTTHGFFYTYEEKSNALVFKVGAGIYRAKVGFELKKGEGLAGKVWQTEEPLIVDDYQSWEGRHPDPIWDPVVCAAGVPLKSKDRFLGVIGYLHTEKGRQIEPHEFELLSRFAEIASIVLDNAQLYAKLEEELKERRRVEAALGNSEERYRTVVEDMAEYVLRWKPDGSILFANDVYCRYKNHTQSQIIGSNVKKLFSTPAYDQALKILARLNPDHPLEVNDISTMGEDNRPIWEEWTDRGIFDENGSLIEVQSVGRNITERKLSEKALRESEYRFRSFFDSSPDGIILVDLDGNVLDANKNLMKFTGYTMDELRGKAYQAITHPKYHSQIARRITNLLRGIAEDEALEIEYINKDGVSTPVAVRGWVITDEKSKPLAIGGFIRDISRERTLVSDKAALEKQLQHTQKMEAIGTLAGGIAHDFNNILAGIIGYAELTLSELPKSDTTLNHYVSRVLDAGNRAKSLVQQILKFSRKDDTTLVPLSISPLLKEAIKLLRSTLPATIRINEDVRADPDTVVADATQLHQVIMNLCTNAYHAMRTDGGTLTVSLSNQRIAKPRYFLASKISPGDYVKLSVTDTGHGIPAEILDRIFEPYFTTKDIHEGTGLGLSVTFGIIKNLNGLIEVEHTSPGSTTFSVFLPLQEQVGLDGEKITQRLPTGSNEMVLCVDDERIFLEVVQKHLEQLGYRVTAYKSSLRALERFKTDPASFDLIITDQMMPEMTGVQLSAEIRKINTSIPIILCTGYTETVTANTAEKFGISNFLMKPVTRSELAKTVFNVLQQ